MRAILHTSYLKQAMRANEKRGELMLLLAYINETKSLERIKTFVQDYLPTSQRPENLAEAQRRALLQSIDENEDESLLVSEAAVRYEV